jgi:hypothetical protein
MPCDHEPTLIPSAHSHSHLQCTANAHFDRRQKGHSGRPYTDLHQYVQGEATGFHCHLIGKGETSCRQYKPSATQLRPANNPGVDHGIDDDAHDVRTPLSPPRANYAPSHGALRATLQIEWEFLAKSRRK